MNTTRPWVWLKQSRQRLRDDSGNVLLLTAVSMVAMCGLGALAIDAGIMMAKQQAAQAGADAGALAGASNLLAGAQAAANTAYQYATNNDPNTGFTATADDDANTVTVKGSQQVSLWLARVLGYKSHTITANASASIGTLIAGKGMVPLAVPDQTFTYGEEVSLSQGAGSGTTGNYGFLNLSGQGAIGLETDIENGYNFPLHVGETVSTETGVNQGDVKTAIDYRLTASASNTLCDSYTTALSDCSQVMYLPVVNTLGVNGTSTDVTIVGFAAFYLEGLVNSGGLQYIDGRFIRMVRPGEMGYGTNYGLDTVKLTS